MANNPDIQQKLHEHLSDFDEKNKNMTLEQLNELTFLDQCIKENLRISPPVANIVRIVGQDTLLDGHLVPKNLLSLTFVHAIHHDEEIYPDPEVFDPSRFEPENFAKIPPGAFIAFGDGPRHCIGDRLAILESKIIFSNIIKKFRVELVDEQELRLKIDLLTKPEIPLKFRIIPR
ncbi:cytochrome P450 4c3-like [Brevipalpus obovatus]|uniref:cytochrome P450 4c3-like n=1 Tax=Brevipalpus obovatus TaxID=246614 RepID=UPI003D9E37B5